MGFAPENKSGGTPNQEENCGSGMLMVAIFAAGKRLAPQFKISTSFYLLKACGKLCLHCLNTMGLRSKI